MKQGCRAIHAAVPVQLVDQLDQLPARNRTKSVNAAIAAYLEVQGQPVNRCGVDCDYFKRKMQRIMAGMENYTPDELRREFLSMADVADYGDSDREAINEQV